MDGLAFIEDAKLRKTIEDSIEFTYTLFEEAKAEGKSALYREETNRVIILYAVAAIEAILLFLYKKSGKTLTSFEYKFVQQLAPEFRHSSDVGSYLVVAVKQKTAIEDQKIMMRDLVNFFREEKFIKQDMVDELAHANGLRNTFHLTKSRETSVCDTAQAESALKLLLDVIEDVPKAVLNT